MRLILDLDDFSPVRSGLECLQTIKEHFPKFKVTLFTPAANQLLITGKFTKDKYKEWTKIIRSFDWIEICPHGFGHLQKEMDTTKDEATKIIENCEKVFKDIDLPYKKIWKSPFWQTSKDAYEVLRDKGYTVATDPNQPDPKIEGLKQYQYDWSIEKPIPKQELIKAHGHVDTMDNSIERCYTNILDLPTDTEFLFISEYLNEK
ncbi:DUF2334 domain-containing protein [Candidatus Dojkabacteria bacterium]|jgi:hypothetical protein|nr:DUF2334 domain-containing protein [Candidatus Dojkabacteria bacterium]